MVRYEGRERDRYRRASLREQLEGELASLRGHPALIALIVAIVGGWLFFLVSRPQVLHVTDLAVGDCLYIHAANADTDAAGGSRLGTELAVVDALYGQGAERASCTMSHGHEVADRFDFDEPRDAAFPGQAVLENRVDERCAAAFAAYVGHPLEGSAFALTVAAPTEAAWAAGVRAGACLVSSGSGGFLSTPARGSGR